MLTAGLSSMFAVTWAVYGLVPLFALAYLVIRWRQYREAAPADPELGLKTVYGYFRFLGSHLVMAASAMILYAALAGGRVSSEDLLRAGLGLFLPGALVFAVSHGLMTRTNVGLRPAVARFFYGVNVFLCGLVAVIGLTASSVLALQKHTPDEAIKIALIVLVVYLTGAFAHWRALASPSHATRNEPGPDEV